MVTYEHSTGFRLSVPVGWELIEDPTAGVALVAVEPAAPAGFRANIVVTIEAQDDLETWQRTTDEQLADQLPHFTLIDWEQVDHDGRRFIRRLAHYVGDDTGPVTMEQWATICDHVGYTITASVATLSYDSLAEAFAETATSLRTGREPS